jgi:hypothetical protein
LIHGLAVYAGRQRKSDSNRSDQAHRPNENKIRHRS